MKLLSHRKKVFPMTIDLHVLITSEDDVYDAVCLEMGLAASARDMESVRQEMVALIVAHIRGCIEEGRPQDMFVPASPEYWEHYAEAVASNACRQRRKLEIPKTPGDLASRWVDRLAAISIVCSAATA